jgi:hypothetical protein
LIRENNIIYRIREEEKNNGKGNMFLFGRRRKKRRGGIYPSCKISYLPIVVLCLYEKW